MPKELLKEPITITKQKWDKSIIPLVSISCITYNHEEYIRDSIEGFLMQKTTFPVEILIHDDASTDKTSEIIREYEKKFPDLIFPIFQKVNQYSKGINIPLTFQYPRARGKYYGGAEGDDYWIDPYKLQKQVDFLEANPEYGLVHTELDHYYVTKGRYVKNHWKTSGVTNQSGDLYESILGGQGSMIYACTACFKTNLIEDIDLSKFSKYLFGDIPLWLHIASKARIGYINESTAVRNVLPFSATQGRSFNYKLKCIESSLLVFNDFNKIRQFSKVTFKKYMQIQNQNICKLCYQFRTQFYLFDEHFKKLEDNYRTTEIKLMRFFFKNRIPIFLSNVILKIIRFFSKL
ncbi:MAG: glycosyltransferase [Bacteroidales bacterium]|nr:glycosyltransferase [Bacteroidales bacterium]